MTALILTAMLSAEPVSGAPLFIVETTGGTAKIGQIDTLSDRFAVVLNQPAARVAEGEFVALHRADVPRPPRPSGSTLELANGDSYVLEANLGGDEATAKFTVKLTGTGDSAALSVPLASLRAVWFGDAATPSQRNFDWLDTSKKQDALLLRNGDVIPGVLAQFADTGAVQFIRKGDAQPTRYAPTALAALVLDCTVPKPPKATTARLVLLNGTRLTAKNVSIANGLVQGVGKLGMKFTLPLAQLHSVDVDQGNSVDLTTLKPKAVTYEPYGGIEWPMQLNRSNKLGALLLKTSLGEEQFDRGFGLHSQTTLTYVLDGKYQRFEGLIGLNAHTGTQGHAELSILVDGKEYAWSKTLAFDISTGVQAISVPLLNAKELSLIVGYGKRGDVQDDVDLVQPRLILK